MDLEKEDGRFQKFFTPFEKFFTPYVGIQTFGRLKSMKDNILVPMDLKHIWIPCMIGFLVWDSISGQFWERKMRIVIFGFEGERKTSKIFFWISKLATQWLFPITWDSIRLHETSHRPPSPKSFYKTNFESYKMYFLVRNTLDDDSSKMFLQFW